MNVIKGMNVKVISGNHKGKEGKVLYVLPKKQRIYIEGVNLIKRHVRPSQENPKGGFIEKEGSIHVSNVMIIVDGKPTRINNKILKDGSKVKISNKTGNQIK
tara:strand:+ start:50 stop:355 length:306 start_codon:yes stop_codon:yes gene_type:complete